MQVQSQGEDFTVLYNHAEITSEIDSANASYRASHVELIRTAANSITTVFANGISVDITLAVGIINFILTLPQSFQGQTKGLLGTYNGNTSDDFLYPNGTFLSSDASDRVIHSYGQACMSVAELHTN